MSLTVKKKSLPVDLTLKDLQSIYVLRLRHMYENYFHTIPSKTLREAIAYNLLNHGKLLRPFLIYTSGLLFDAPLENLDIPACAVEMIHTYSLIHDDLPCMDDAAFRRGKATSHQLFGEGIAVLTGDAIHTLALQIMATHPSRLSAEKRLAMIETLCLACGPYGMAGGQALDITEMNKDSITEEQLINIYHLKTGALFSACLELGRLASNNDSSLHQSALKSFGDCVGLAFQIQDDLLDIESSSEDLGKPQGLDAKLQKITYPQLMGSLHAKKKVNALYEEAIAAVDGFGKESSILQELIGILLHRTK